MKKNKIKSIIIGLTLISATLVGCKAEETTPTVAPETQAIDVKVFQGLGQVPAFRVGPGKDKKEVQVYSFSYLTASGTFDKDGKIINIYFDALEVSSPNYDGESMPHMSGWPGTEGYNVTDHATQEVTSVSENTNETIAAEINGWKTKRERGDKYGMNYANDWHQQADFYQEFFKGKTIADIEAWYAKYCSDVNGRPLTAKSEKPEDIAKLGKLTDAEKKDLVDVTTGATMSLQDAHGDFLAAIKKAYENKIEVTIPTK
ncbi:MAG: FMN-binding protein [Clostridiaceae bacterium]|nr:FMN-binding protein [Clostridiaceae bacterium]